MSNGKTWDTNDIDFDKEGRLVIKNPDLSRAIENEFDKKNYLVIRMVPWMNQRRQPTGDLVPPPQPAMSPFRLPMEAELVPWGGVDRWMGRQIPAPPAQPASGSNPSGSGSTPPGPAFYSLNSQCRIPPPDPADLGCGCDINLRCP